MEFGVHYGVVVALAITQLHFDGGLRNVVGLLESMMWEDIDRLADDFDAAMNAVLGEVSMEEIIHGLP